MAQRGGARPGSGRKPRIVKAIEKGVAYAILSPEFEKKKWTRLLDSEDERVVLESLKYLTDRRDGKAPQSVKVDGEIEVIGRVVVNL